MRIKSHLRDSMAQEKKEDRFFKKLIDSHRVLGTTVTDEGLQTYLSKNVKSIIDIRPI